MKTKYIYLLLAGIFALMSCEEEDVYKRQSPHRMFLLNTLPCVCVLQYGMPVMRMFVFLLILLRRTVR